MDRVFLEAVSIGRASTFALSINQSVMPKKSKRARDGLSDPSSIEVSPQSAGLRLTAQTLLDHLQSPSAQGARSRRSPARRLSPTDLALLQVTLAGFIELSFERDDLADRVNRTFEIIGGEIGTLKTRLKRIETIFSRPRELWTFGKRRGVVDKELLARHYALLTGTKGGPHNLAAVVHEGGKWHHTWNTFPGEMGAWQALEVLADLHGISSAESALRHLQGIRKKSRDTHEQRHRSRGMSMAQVDDQLWMMLDNLPSVTDGERAQRRRLRKARPA